MRKPDYCEVCGCDTLLGLHYRAGMFVCDGCFHCDRWTIPVECPAPYCECAAGQCKQRHLNCQRYPDAALDEVFALPL